jgi:hypothetical protein
VGPVLIWHAPLGIGEYDSVIDANRNGVYDASTDGLDSGSPGLSWSLMHRRPHQYQFRQSSQ